MSELPTPEEIEDAKKRSVQIAAATREHFDALKDSGFEDDEAFELATNYHWYLLTDDEDED